MSTTSRLHVGRRVLVVDTLPSTNDYARRLTAGDVVRAREQTAGRGQYGRSWVSPADSGVWLSAVVSPPAELCRPVVLTAWAAVAVAEAVRPLVNRQPAVKWPNDLLVKGKKIAGVLIERQGATVIAGVGLNVRQTQADFDAAGLPDAGSLQTVSGSEFDLDAAAEALVDSLEREYVALIGGELSTLESTWKWRIGLLGRPVIATLHDGREVSGRLTEMAFDGVVIESRAIAPEQIRSLTPS